MTYNRKKLLNVCLNSLFAQEYPKNRYEIIVVDDGSTDDTEQLVKKLQKYHKNLRYIKHEKNKGVATARNTGIKNAKYDLMGLIADDYILPLNYLSITNDFFKKHKKALAVRFNIECYDKKSFFMRLNHFYYITSLKNLMKEKNLNNIKDKPFYKVPFEGGCIIKKELFNKVGLFNEKLKLGEEDTEFGYRSKFPLYFIGTTYIKHWYRNKLIPSLQQKYWYGYAQFNLMKQKKVIPFFITIVRNFFLELSIRFKYSESLVSYIIYFPFLILFLMILLKRLLEKMLFR